MSNMSYCRFTNTVEDLQDCEDNLFDEVSPEEHKKRMVLIKICKRIAESFEGEDNGQHLPSEEDVVLFIENLTGE
jgi:hypothetical protein